MPFVLYNRSVVNNSKRCGRRLWRGHCKCVGNSINDCVGNVLTVGWSIESNVYNIQFHNFLDSDIYNQCRTAPSGTNELTDRAGPDHEKIAQFWGLPYMY